MTSNDKNFQLLGQKSPYRRRRRVRRSDFMKNRLIVPGIPVGFLRPKYKTQLPKFEIPLKLKRIFAKSESDALLTSELEDLRLDNASNYEKFFNILLFAEEYQMVNDIMLYDQEGVEMEKRRPYFILQVPGLAEKRPSVIVGDHVFVVKCGEDERGKAYQGFIHHVEETTISVKFPKAFSNVYSSNTKFNVRFTFNRLPMRRMHNAIKCADTINRLFPSNELRTPSDVDEIIQRNSFKAIDKTIENNKHQMRAVILIKQELYHPAPFIVFGPPGTGKSVTIVEAMKQLLDEKGNVRILACAPSNSAADVLLMKLRITLSPDKVARINATYRDIKKVYTDENLRGYCKDLDLKSFENHKIIVSTCITAGAIHALGGRKKYTHIFIDEAGQAMEPEVMTALQNASKDTKIILAGDPRQLGPIVHSSIAKRLGLGNSLIERLVNKENSPYDFSETCTYGVKLRMNYRSHQEIIRVPNELFYNNELEACGDESIIQSLLNSKALHKKNYPIKFVSVCGQDLREDRSPSWFNIAEALEILKIVKELVEKDNVRKEDIGIITPYCKQVEKIKILMENNNFEGLDVGTVENFQGRERPVIIISTVRSASKNLEHDRKFCLGFLNEPKRFCVAVTRARAFMAVVGNPYLLFSDVHWKRWLEEVNRRGGYVGNSFPKEIEDDEEPH